MTALAENLERVEEAIERACRVGGTRAQRSGADGRFEDLSGGDDCGGRGAGAAAVWREPGAGVCGEGSRSWMAAAGSRCRGGCAGAVHLIGHLQSNKAARAVELFDAVDSVDSLKLAERLNEAAGKLGSGCRC